VSILILTKNSANTLGYTPQSINQTYRNYEIIVVDNSSADNTVKLARQYTNNAYIEAPERSAQVNFGIRKATGKYIYEMGSDFVLEPTVIEEAIRTGEFKGYDALAMHYTSHQTISFWARVRKFERNMYQLDDLYVAARFITKDIFDKTDYFHESMVAAEDYDFHNRIVVAGFKVGRINAKETHLGERRALSEIIKKHYYYGTTLPAFSAKNPKKGVKQLSPLRPAYAKRWKLFFRHSVMTVGFLIYQAARYSSAIVGYTTALASKRRRSI
jgi:glycosyltransferase involved in cell wall biosynthesis